MYSTHHGLATTDHRTSFGSQCLPLHHYWSVFCGRCVCSLLIQLLLCVSHFLPPEHFSTPLPLDPLVDQSATSNFSFSRWFRRGSPRLRWVRPSHSDHTTRSEV
jgi:hypothetical protein